MLQVVEQAVDDGGQRTAFGADRIYRWGIEPGSGNAKPTAKTVGLS
jgi:hypothetical protein